MDIFNISKNTTLSDIKKQFYELALLCHPDHGGQTEDMHVLYGGFMKAKEQLTFREDSCRKMDDLLEKLERGETDADTSHNNHTFPSLREIFDDAHADFHRSFEQNKHAPNTEHTTMLCDDALHPYNTQGYGAYMLERWKSSTENAIQYNPNMDTCIEQPSFQSLPHEKMNTTNTTDEHKTTDATNNTCSTLLQPNASLPSGVYPIHVDTNQHIHDFSVLPNTSLTNNNQTTHIHLYDYREAFTQQPPQS